MEGEVPGFTAVRACLCLMIIFYHAYSTNYQARDRLIEDYGYKGFFHCILERGYIGADGFLMISGWLNAQSLHSSFKKSSFWETSVKFWIRRYFRIAPLVYFYLIIVYIFFDVCDIKAIIGNFIFLGNCTNVYCLTSLWYINVSMQLFLISPFWIAYCDSLSFNMRMVANGLVASIMYYLAEDITGQFLLHDRGSNYFIGIIFFYLSIHLPNKEETGNKLLNIASVWFVFAIFLISSVIPCYSKKDILVIIPLLGIFLLGCKYQKQDWPLNQYFRNDFFGFISKISYGLYVNHVVFSRDLRLYGQIDDHLPFGQDDLPHPHFWFFLDILSNYIFYIPVSMLTEKYIELPCNKIGNYFAVKVPRDLQISMRKVLIFSACILFGAVTFVANYVPSLHQDNYTPLKIRMSRDFIYGSVQQSLPQILKEYENIKIDDFTFNEEYQLRNISISLVSQSSTFGQSVGLFFDKNSGKLTFEGKDFEIFGNGELIHARRKANLKIQGALGKINYKYRLRQFKRYDGPIFETASQSYVIDELDVIFDKVMFEPNKVEKLMEELRDQMNSQIKLSLIKQQFSEKFLENHILNDQLQPQLPPLNLIKSLAQMSEGNFYSQDELQFNLRYTSIYQYLPVKNPNLQNLKFETISKRSPLIQAIIDTEYINDQIKFYRNHKGWLKIESDDIDFWRNTLEIKIPKNIQEMRQIINHIDSDISDQQEISYEWTLNSMKDSYLNSNDQYGMHFTQDGELKFNQQIAIRAYYYKDGYRQEIRRFYPELQLKAKLELNQYQSELTINLQQLQFAEFKVRANSILIPEEEYEVAQAANLAIQKYQKILSQKVIILLHKGAGRAKWLECLGVAHPEISLKFRDRTAQIDIVGSTDMDYSQFRSSKQCQMFQHDLVNNFERSLFFMLFEDEQISELSDYKNQSIISDELDKQFDSEE
eukprot:403346203